MDLLLNRCDGAQTAKSSATRNGYTWSKGCLAGTPKWRAHKQPDWRYRFEHLLHGSLALYIVPYLLSMPGKASPISDRPLEVIAFSAGGRRQLSLLVVGSSKAPMNFVGTRCTRKMCEWGSAAPGRSIRHGEIRGHLKERSQYKKLSFTLWFQ